MRIFIASGLGCVNGAAPTTQSRGDAREGIDHPAVVRGDLAAHSVVIRAQRAGTVMRERDMRAYRVGACAWLCDAFYLCAGWGYPCGHAAEFCANPARLPAEKIICLRANFPLAAASRISIYQPHEAGVAQW